MRLGLPLGLFLHLTLAHRPTASPPRAPAPHLTPAGALAAALSPPACSPDRCKAQSGPDAERVQHFGVCLEPSLPHGHEGVHTLPSPSSLPVESTAATSRFASSSLRQAMLFDTHESTSSYRLV